MPMWGGAYKGRPVLVINTMEFTRAKLDKDRRNRGKLLKRQQEENARATPSASELRETFNKAIRISLRELGEAYVEMANARKVKANHIEILNQIASDLQDLASSADYSTLGRAAASLTRLTQQPSKGASHPDLIKLHLDSLRSLAGQAFKDQDDETSLQLLNALKLSVDSVMSV